MSEEGTLWQLRKLVGEVFPELSLQKEIKVLEGHLHPDHIHMLPSMPPKYAVVQAIGYLIGKSTIYTARESTWTTKELWRYKCWGVGVFSLNCWY